MSGIKMAKSSPEEMEKMLEFFNGLEAIPGVRKGKQAGRLTKVYVLAKSCQVPSASYLLVNGHIVIHPAIWAQVEVELEKLDAPQMAYGWM